MMVLASRRLSAQTLQHNPTALIITIQTTRAPLVMCPADLAPAMGELPPYQPSIDGENGYLKTGCAIGGSSPQLCEYYGKLITAKKLFKVVNIAVTK